MLPVLPKRSREAGRPEGPGAARPRRDPPAGASLQGAGRGLPLGAQDAGAVVGAPLSTSSVDIASPPTRVASQRRPRGRGHTHADEMGTQQCLRVSVGRPFFQVSHVTWPCDVAHLQPALWASVRENFPSACFWRGAGEDRGAAVHSPASAIRILSAEPLTTV